MSNILINKKTLDDYLYFSDEIDEIKNKVKELYGI